MAGTTYAVGAFPQSMVLNDLNGDGYPDIVTANKTANSITMLLNQGDGTFAAGITYSVGVFPKGIAVGDVNGDGYPDIVTLNYLSHNVTVLLSNSFTSTSTRITTRSPTPQPSTTSTRKRKQQSQIGNNPPPSHSPSDVGERRQRICGGRWRNGGLCRCHFLCRPRFRFLRNKNGPWRISRPLALYVSLWGRNF